MNTTNVIPMTRPADDLCTMVRLCNSPKQQERRQQKRKQTSRSMCARMMALHTFLVSAGAILGLVVGIVAF